MSKTKKQLIAQIYDNQRTCSRGRGHRPPEYNQRELSEWLFSQELFHKLYDEWKQSGFMSKLVPSVDRKHDEIHYCMNNIQLMTWDENRAKGNRDKGTRRKIAIVQLHKDGTYIATFDSGKDASIELGVSKQAINAVLKGRSKTAGGFKWGYSDE